MISPEQGNSHTCDHYVLSLITSYISELKLFILIGKESTAYGNAVAERGRNSSALDISLALTDGDPAEE